MADDNEPIDPADPAAREARKRQLERMVGHSDDIIVIKEDGTRTRADGTPLPTPGE